MPKYSDRRQYNRASHSPSRDYENLPDAGPTLRASLRIPHGVPVNLNVLPDPPPGEKPTATLDTLVQLAIYGSPAGRLTLQEIYAAIGARFDWYKKSDSNWRASIRHMLSLKSVFKSTERPPTAPGRGSYWQLDPTVKTKYKRPRKRSSKGTHQNRNPTRGSSLDSDNSSNHVDDTRRTDLRLDPDTISLAKVQPVYAHHHKASPSSSTSFDNFALNDESGYGHSRSGPHLSYL
ncbi:fork head domain-containing protein [Lentinula raphanica]|nr:fork head domain-containing protein [Lentinula raphanica]